MEPWPPLGDKKSCQNCGDHVSDEFRRSAGDADGYVHACPNCTEFRRLARAARGLEPRQQDGQVAADGGERL